MKLTIVGSGTTTPDPERVGPALFIDAAGTRILIDCGPGALHHMARFALPWTRLDHLVLSHFHNDHIGDVPALFFALKWGEVERRTAELHVWGPRGTGARIQAMADAFGDHLSEPGFPVAIHELAPGDRAQLRPGLSLACAGTPHTDGSLAYRIEEERGGSMGYTGDTGPSDALARFLSGLDVLVAECSLPDDDAIDMHLTPSRLAAMAHIARPRRLVITHVFPSLARLDPVALLAQAGWAGEAVRAHDGLDILVAPDP